MKTYSKLDTNVPMAFYYFYIYVRMPISVIRVLYNLITGNLSGKLSIIFSFMETITLFCACFGLIKKQYWGYKINKILLIIQIIIGLCWIPIGILNTYLDELSAASASLGTAISMLIVYPLIFIYFEKRKYLFDGAPQQITNTIPALDSREQIFTHTCSHCGKTFKAKYTMPEGQTSVPKLSVICPQCKSKEII